MQRLVFKLETMKCLLDFGQKLIGEKYIIAAKNLMILILINGFHIQREEAFVSGMEIMN